MHHDASKLQVPSLGWLQIVGFAGIVELNIYNEQVNDEPGDLHSWHLISGRNWCGHVNLTQYPMCHQADHWILWHVDRTLQTNAETVKTYVNSRLASFHFAPSISFNDLMVFFFVLLLWAGIEQASDLDLTFWIHSSNMFQSPFLLGWERIIQSTWFWPICEETMVLVSLVSDPLASWYLVLQYWQYSSLHCQVFLFTPIRSFPEKAKACKGHKGSADDAMLLMRPTWGTAALLILKFAGKNSTPNLPMEDWPCLQSSECFSRSHGFAWRYLEVCLRCGTPKSSKIGRLFEILVLKPAA